MARKKTGGKRAAKPRAGARKKTIEFDEQGAIRKSRRGRIRVALCYPNSYRVAMGSLAFHHVYHLFNLHDDVACERAVMLPDGKPSRTIESNSPITSFDIIAFTISYEADLPNLAAMLHRAGVPLDPDRREELAAPLILAGGVICMMNPEPLAPFVDVVSVGEGEETIPPLLDVLRKAGIEDWRKKLHVMARTAGLYVPSLYQVLYGGDGRIAERKPLYKSAPALIKRAFKKDLSDDPARTRVFTDQAEFSDMALIELSRGCVHACRYCAAAYVYRPPRWVKAEAVAEALEDGFEHRDKAGLVCASATDHPEFASIRAWIRDQGKAHSVASLRFDQVTPELLDDIHASGHRTLTVAPEAGHDRLRNVINKPMTNRNISRAAEMVGASRIPRLKLYFMVGLPFETSNDVDGIAPLVAMIKAFLAKGAGKKNWPGRITVSVNPFTPKPATPFQWREMEDAKNLATKLDHVQRSVRKLGGVAVHPGSVREALLQAAIARGDRRTGQAIAAAVIDGKNPATYLKTGHGATPPAKWYIHRPLGKAEPLPWDFIDHRVAKSLLWKDYERAGVGRTTAPCKPGGCERCDACVGL